ncbi:MAG: hypothetical protein IKU79_05425 [Bacteroidaceae bacterium]|nr:hypothetical protein [Bacteroidaceae bacterium]
MRITSFLFFCRGGHLYVETGMMIGNFWEYDDYDVEDLAPSGVVVECSHSGNLN